MKSLIIMWTIGWNFKILKLKFFGRVVINRVSLLVSSKTVVLSCVRGAWRSSKSTKVDNPLKTHRAPSYFVQN